MCENQTLLGQIHNLLIRKMEKRKKWATSEMFLFNSKNIDNQFIFAGHAIHQHISHSFWIDFRVWMLSASRSESNIHSVATRFARVWMCFPSVNVATIDWYHSLQLQSLYLCEANAAYKHSNIHSTAPYWTYSRFAFNQTHSIRFIYVYVYNLLVILPF